MGNTMTTLNDQIELEKDCFDRGVTRYRTNVKKMEDKERASGTKYAQALMYHQLQGLTDAIEDARKPSTHGGGVRPLVVTAPATADKLAFISITCIIDQCARHFGRADGATSILTVANSIGVAVLTELRLTEWVSQTDTAKRMIRKANEKMGNSTAHKRAGLEHKIASDGANLITLSVLDRQKIGLKLIDCVIRETGIVEVRGGHRGSKGKKVPTKLVFTKEAEEFITKFNEFNEGLVPHRAPCIVPPKPWDSLKGGGYYTRWMPPIKLLKRSKARQDVKKLTQELGVMNTLQDTAWRINADILDVFSSLWEAGSEIAGLPPRDPREIPRSQITMDKEDMSEHELEQLKAAKADMAKIYRLNAQEVSTRISTQYTLTEATRFAEYGSIWFPYQCDFRGRKYPVAGYVNPQGSDLSKALLEFASPALIETDEDAEWLAIHGANLFGVDKVSLLDRQLWVEFNTGNAQAVATDPLGNLWWTTADKPWQALAWCIEWAGWVHARATQQPYETRLVCASDGTCNGLQHLSALLRDPVGGASVNLTNGDVPSDIYTDVARVTMDILKATTGENADIAAHWYNIGIDRKITKRPVMIVPYSGTKASCFEYILDSVTDKLGDNHPFGEGFYGAVGFLRDCVWEAIEKSIVAAPLVMNYIRDLALLYADNDMILDWETPTGVMVELRYEKSKSVRIKTHINGSVMKLSSNVSIKDTIQRRKVGSAASPNFIHSMDAAHLVGSVVNARDSGGIQDFAMVHDSFGTHAPMMGNLNKGLREAFVELYEGQDFLATLGERARRELPEDVTLPSVPMMRGLDLNEVLVSPYFFS